MEGHVTSATGSASATSTTTGATSTSSGASTTSSASTDAIIQRLIKCGIPADYLEKGQTGFVDYLKEYRLRLPAVVAALLPGPDEVQAGSSAGPDESQGAARRKEFQNQCRDALKWAQWAMFEGEPQAVLLEVGQANGGSRGVCGAVWGSNDIAYRCRTCEHDPTCAICVPCFQAGNHAAHDYSMIRTGGGCCDCGDITAWKETGFCSRHSGPGQVGPLPLSFLASATPVLEALLLEWRGRLQAAELVAEGKSKRWILQTVEEKVASQISVACIEMLVEFCNCSESMLTFTAELTGKKSIGILDTLMRTECFLRKPVITSLHELLYKLLGDTSFKYAFAQAFISHYPKFLRDSVTEETAASAGSPSSKFRDQAILSNFSVQIFTVPTLTPKLVKESRLLDMLLETLKEFFQSCVGEDGRIMVSKSPIVSRLYFRPIEDIRYVMSHLEVAQHVAQERPELARAWLQLLAFVQGMYPQRRITSIHVEEENEDWGSTYLLEGQMATIHPLYVAGAARFGQDELTPEKLPKDKLEVDFGRAGGENSDSDNCVTRHAKVGRISREPDIADAGRSSSGPDSDLEMYDATSTVDVHDCCTTESDALENEREEGRVVATEGMVMPAALSWLISECTQVLDTWLAVDASRELAKSGETGVDAGQGSGQRRGTQWRGRGGRGIGIQAPSAEPPSPAEDMEGGSGRGGMIREWLWRGRRSTATDYRAVRETRRDRALPRESAASGQQAADMDVDILQAGVSEAGQAWGIGGTEWWMGSEAGGLGVGAGQLLEEEEWPAVEFDVSRQEVSYHIPLHRMLALLLHKALELYSGREGKSGKFLVQLFPTRFQVSGFAAVLMEHPLRLQVLCAQVQAGMWRRNGHSTSGLCDLYHTVHWCEDSLELDLFLLQCCSVMAPPEEFVERIQARFGLADYFTLFLWRANEYEPLLAQELLVLLIRLVSERGFCGLTTAEALRRELVQRLAVGDATHSSLLKALPPRLQESKHVQECLDSVAKYRNPSGMQQGKYVLREECWRELDLYHPRWSPRELQSAEERYLRACKAPAVFQQLPRWKEPFGQLQAMGRYILSARVHDMLRAVFFHAAYAGDLSDSRAPEGLLFTAFHLLALALDVCASLHHKPSPSSKAGIPVLEVPSSGLPQSVDPSYSCTTSTCNETQEQSPLLSRAVERVFVGGADGTVLPERQSLLSLLVLLLRKFSSGDRSCGSAGEAGHYNVCDLIKSLLGRFAELSRGCMYEIEALAPEILHRPSTGGTHKAGASREVDTKEQESFLSDTEKRRAIARERQAAVMAKMKAAQDRFAASLQPTEESSGQGYSEEAKRSKESERGRFDGMCDDSNATSCALCRDSASASPLCFLILVQKSKLLAIAEKATPSWERSSATVAEAPMEREGEVSGSGMDGGSRDMQTTADLWHWIQNALGDAQTRTRLLEGEDLLELLRNGLPPGIRNAVRMVPGVIVDATAAPPADTQSEEAESSGEITEADISSEHGTSEAAGASDVNWWEENHGGGNQEENSTSRDVAIATVLAEYVAAVSRIPLDRQRHGGGDSPRQGEADQGREGGAARGRRTAARAPPIAEATLYNSIGINDTVGIYLSACGHAVHQECLDRYFSSLLQRYYSRALFEGVQIVDPDMGEFLCPVCRRLANSILPVLPRTAYPNTLSQPPSNPQIFAASTPSLQLQHALQLLVKAEELVSKPGFRKVVELQLPDSVKAVLEALAMRLCGLFYPEKDHFSTLVHGRVHQGLLLWDVFRYSVISAELAARSHKVGAGIASGLVALGEVGDASRGSVLPLLLHAAKATQSQSRQAVLLRARGMQLLLDSIVNGTSRELSAEKALHGNFSSLLQYFEKGHDSADVQFWTRMADPVLVHDPFSSFIWLLFCLPSTLPANGAPFTALVHLFYLVCVTQVIAQAGVPQALNADLTPSAHAFVTALHATLAGTVLARPSLDEGTADIPAGSPVIVIRRLTLPFLRRCALLQNLMSGSTQVHPIARAHTWELPQGNGFLFETTPASRYFRHGEGQVLQEMEELEQLERAFSVPGLPELLDQEGVQSVVLRWCQHVKTDTGIRYFRHGPRLTTAAPFKLMQLPHLFQDLLQRYVKERCPRCNTVPDRPALCLLCGALCCAVSQRPCCSMNRQGECYRHAMACGAGIGVFLMLRHLLQWAFVAQGGGVFNAHGVIVVSCHSTKRTNILLQRCERQAMWPSPYLDAFGEEDIELRRGKPLHLSQDRYAALTAMVASHGLDYSSLVLSHTTRDTLF